MDDSSERDPLRGYPDFNTFFSKYMSVGFQCVFAHNGWKDLSDPDIPRDLTYCGFGYLWTIGYVLSLFVLQACLTTVSHKDCD